MRDHGGNLDAAIAQFGRGDWIDLSTGINRRPYPLPEFAPQDWTALPTASAMAKLRDAAAQAYGTTAERVLPLSGAQAAIQLYPRLSPPGTARILSPTYNEHAGSLSAQDWQVDTVQTLGALAGADLAVVVNPNNPDGKFYPPEALVDLSKNTGLLIVDESFADPTPELSVAGHLCENLLVLRSFGKFYGLAGARLGFALGTPELIDPLRALSGPWSVSGPALALGTKALRDHDWAHQTILRLNKDAQRLDTAARTAGWDLIGGTPLFRTYATPDARAAQAHLARHHIWSRIFPYSPHWIRLGLPDGTHEWDRIAAALTL